MVNNNNEQDMVNKLVSNYTSIKFVYQNVKKNPDVGFSGQIDGNNYFFILEAKKYNKDNRSNYPKQLLTEILINRDCISKKVIENNSDNPESYGILLSFDNGKTDGIYDFLKAHITLDDWNKFGDLYNCQYVFLYDETGEKLYFQEWENFLVSCNPTEYICNQNEG